MIKNLAIAVGGLLFIGLLYAIVIPNLKPLAPAQQACTQEAMICPDGSAVGRTGPNCEFAACPSDASSTPQLPQGPYMPEVN